MKIGGEFEIDIKMLLGNIAQSKSEPSFMTGRDALKAILRFLYKKHGVNTIWLPDYLCQSVFRAAKNEKYNIRFYGLTPQLLPNLDQIKSDKNTAVLLINYFGITNLDSTIDKLLQSDLFIIEDLVQSYFTFNKTSKSHFRFTGFRKALPVPEGALVKTQFEFNSESWFEMQLPQFATLKYKGGLLKSWSKDIGNDKLYLNAFEEGEKIADSPKICKAVTNADAYVNSLDINLFAEKRIENYNSLFKSLKDFHITGNELSPGEVPLFFPMRLPAIKRNRVREMMMKEKIYLPVHWPLFDGLPNNATGASFANEELSLIVDQRYSTNDMKRQTDLFIKAIEKV